MRVLSDADNPIDLGIRGMVNTSICVAQSDLYFAALERMKEEQ